MKAKFLNECMRNVTVAATAFVLCAACLVTVPGCRSEDDPQARRERIDALYEQSSRHFREVPEISAEELLERIETEEIVLVDAREKVERDISMIPGAISLREFENGPEDYARAVVVIYCTIGERSGLHGRRLREREIDAYNLRGGLLAWAHAGGAFVDGAGKETNRAHVYGRRWNLLPEGYEAVW